MSSSDSRTSTVTAGFGGFALCTPAPLYRYPGTIHSLLRTLAFSVSRLPWHLLCCLIFVCAAILYVLALRRFLYWIVVVVVVVVDHDEKCRTTLISRPVEVGFQRRLNRTLTYSLPLTMKKRIIPFGLLLIEVWHFKKKEYFHLLLLFLYYNFCYTILVTMRVAPFEPEGAN
jgi:hypothetical protein